MPVLGEVRVLHWTLAGGLMYGKEESLLGGVDKRLALSIPGHKVLGVCVVSDHALCTKAIYFSVFHEAW